MGCFQFLLLWNRVGIIHLPNYRYLGIDAHRDCDLKVVINVPKTMHIYYVHTHRFFTALLEFWLQFNELQEIVGKSKKRNISLNSRLTRVLLDVDIGCPTTMIFPLNQFSEQVFFEKLHSISCFSGGNNGMYWCYCTKFVC